MRAPPEGRLPAPTAPTAERSYLAIGTVLNLRTTTSQKREAVSRRARIQGSQTSVSLNSRLESKKPEEKTANTRVRVSFPVMISMRFFDCVRYYSEG